MSEDVEPQLVAQRYFLLERLGRGGMGTVWRARDQLLGRTVALKQMHLHPGDEGYTTQVDRAHREARALARVAHPNVVNVYDVVSHDEQLWLVMELVEGRSLAEHVAADGPLAPSDVAGIGLQLLAALEAVHAAGALHRDVKPGNVLVRADGRAVLCDFGIAALTDTTSSPTRTGTLVGSLAYIAPERLDDRPVGPPSDLFSLGVTLCALMSGHSPFARPEAAAVLNAIARQRPEIPAAAGPLRSPLEALMRKDPAKRPTIAEANALLRAVATAPPHAAAPAPPDPRRITGPLRRPRLWVALSAVSLAALLAATGWVLADDDGAPPAHPAPAGAAPKAADRTPLTHIDAAMPLPGGTGTPENFLLFSGDHCLRAKISSGEEPVQQRLTDLLPLDQCSNAFKGLLWDGVDAVLARPNAPGQYYVFSGDQYILIQVAAAANGKGDALVDGPSPLTEWSKTFGSFSEGPIDATMIAPNETSQYWIFSGNKYIRVELGQEIDGKLKIAPQGFNDFTGQGGWPNTFSLYRPFTTKVDAVIPIPQPTGGEDYWVFSGSYYMKIRITNTYYVDSTVQQPRKLNA